MKNRAFLVNSNKVFFVMSLITIDSSNIHSVFDLVSAIRDADCSFQDRARIADMLDEMIRDIDVLETRERENELKLNALKEITWTFGGTRLLVKNLIKELIEAKGRKRMTIEAVDEFELKWEHCIPDGAVAEILDPFIQDIAETVRESIK
nr:MAG TPA: hypothetical protein [Caudoviricetes sp.]